MCNAWTATVAMAKLQTNIDWWRKNRRFDLAIIISIAGVRDSQVEKWRQIEKWRQEMLCRMLNFIAMDGKDEPGKRRNADE